MRVLKVFFFAQNSPTWVGEYATGFKIDDLFYEECSKSNTQCDVSWQHCHTVQ